MPLSTKGVAGFEELYTTISPVSKSCSFIVILDEVVPIPMSVDPNETGLTTNFLIVSLNLKSKVCVLSDVMFNLNSSPIERP